MKKKKKRRTHAPRNDEKCITLHHKTKTARLATNNINIMTLLERLNRDDHFAASIGAKLTEVKEGHAKAQLTVEERHLNGGGVCQGGVMYTLADLAFAAVSNSHGILSLGISNTITFLKSAQLGDTITAECTELLDHHKLPYCNMTITNQNGDLLAAMTGLGYRMKKGFPFDALM